MDVILFENVMIVDEPILMEKERISSTLIPYIYNQIKNFMYMYKNVSKFLKQRYMTRLNRFNLMKRKYILNFTTEAGEMFHNF